jgi:hypothetical protein
MGSNGIKADLLAQPIAAIGVGSRVLNAFDQ